MIGLTIENFEREKEDSPLKKALYEKEDLLKEFSEMMKNQNDLLSVMIERLRNLENRKQIIPYPV